MKAIHQFVAGFTQGDAISNEALVMRDIFRSWGYDSEIVCDAASIGYRVRKQVLPLADYLPRHDPRSRLLLHLSIGSPANAAFAELNARKALLYHNVTPSHYFDLVNQRTADVLARGREEASILRNIADINLADSAYNAAELEAMGYRGVTVLPLILDLDKLITRPDGGILARFQNSLTNILFVGRCAPNKKIEDLLNAFSIFQKHVEPHSRFIHVGSFAGAERYYYLLQAQAKELELSNVHFAGSVTQAQLNAYYQCADLFLCASEHEGFCIPLLESMVHDTPILAFESAAVPETLDGAGVLYTKKDYPPIAEMMGHITHDGRLRRGIIASQRQRLERYRGRQLAAELRQHLQPILDE